MTIYGVDVSAYQGKPDWAKVQAAGISFAFAKATQGTTYTASTWAFDQDSMLALQNFQPGAYHFLSATDDPAAQARFFVSKLKSPEKTAIGLDVERYSENGITRRPTIAQARAWATEFRRLLPGHPLMGYIPHWYWEELNKPDLSLVESLWASSYVSGSGTPAALYGKSTAAQWTMYGGRTVGILQFSASGHVGGVDGSVDVNAFRGTLEELGTLTIAPTVSPPPPPPPANKPPIPHPLLDVDGDMGRLTIMALQAATAWRLQAAIQVDGVMSKTFIRSLQAYLRVSVDGVMGPVTTRALQKKVGAAQDGEWGPLSTRALQRALNSGVF